MDSRTRHATSYLFLGIPFLDDLNQRQVVRLRGDLGQQLDSMLSALVSEGFSGSVLVSHNAEIVLEKGYGLADRERRIGNSPHTIFHVASVGKIFTAAAILKLEMQGKLKTTDPISRFLGPFPKSKGNATIHHLLTHTSGLTPDGFELDYNSRSAFVRSVRNAPLESTPGEKYRYSNAGYTLLAAIVEEITGQPFEKYLEGEIFKPAGIMSTGYPWSRKLQNTAIAIGYKGASPDSLVPMPRVKDIWGNRGPGNLVTSVKDLHKWIVALGQGRILSGASRRKMLRAYANETEGYGWHVTRTPRKTRMVRRGGGREDFEAEVQWYLDEDTIVIFALNNDLNFRRRLASAIERIIWPER